MESKTLAKRFREVILNGKWIANTNCQELLKDVNYTQAIKVYQNLNSIAALTFHINYYIQGVLEVLKGGKLTIKDQYSFDLPPLNSEKDWIDLKDKLLANAIEFDSILESFSEAQLNEKFVDEKYGTFKDNINGMIEHSYYHLGQMSLIKKLIKATD